MPGGVPVADEEGRWLWRVLLTSFGRFHDNADAMAARKSTENVCSVEARETRDTVHLTMGGEGRVHWEGACLYSYSMRFRVLW